MLEEAKKYAKQKHEGQLRDEGVPYYEHLEGTMEIVEKEAGISDEETLTIAILHDILEDTDCTYEDLNERFGKRVADCVKLLTRKDGEEFDIYAKKIFTNTEFESVKIVKLADRLHNLRSLLSTNNPEKIKRKILETERCIIIYDKNDNNILMKKIKEQVEYLKKQI